MRMNQSRESRRTKRLATLEAALYAAGRPVGIDSLKRVVQTRSHKVVQKLARELAKRYEARGSALEIKELPRDRVILQLRTKFSKMVRRFAKRPLLTIGPLKTLSYIAYYQPVEQTKVVVDRGNHVYAYLRMMEEMGLITRERASGREVIVSTTPYFADYFSFSHDTLKSRLQLRRMFSRMKITKLNNGNGNGISDELIVVPPVHPEVLADAGDGFPEGLAEYPSPANRD